MQLYHKSLYIVYSGSIKSKEQHTNLCFEFIEGRVMHPVSMINVYMSLAAAKYLFTPK